eukprot:95131-Rhodomonas_salina.3
MPVSGHEMKQILTLTGLASIPSTAVVLDEDFPQQTLQTAITLAKDLQTDLAELIHASCSEGSKDYAKGSEQTTKESKSMHIPSEDYAKAIVSALQLGCTAKWTGMCFASAITESDPCITRAKLTSLEHGGFTAYDGTYVTQKVRQCAHASCVHDNGSSYTGTFVGGRMCGLGTIKHADGTSYTGTFLDNRPHGGGEMKDSDGNITYSGGFCHGRPYGQGCQRVGCGFLRGRWLQGELTCMNAEIEIPNNETSTWLCYKGNSVAGNMHGHGLLKSYDMKKNHCKGTVLWQYDGSFKNNRQHGLGVYHNGKRCVIGLWQDGTLVLQLHSMQKDRAYASVDEYLKEWLKDNVSSKWNSVERATQTINGEHHFNTNLEGEYMESCSNTQHTEIPILSLCTLSSLPRRETSIKSNASIQLLPKVLPSASVFIMEGNVLPVDSCDAPLQVLMQDASGVCVYTVRCSNCTESRHVRVYSECDTYLCLVCDECNKKIHSTKKTNAIEPLSTPKLQMLYCKLCGAIGQRSKSALFRMDLGETHMHRMHNVVITMGAGVGGGQCSGQDVLPSSV